MTIENQYGWNHRSRIYHHVTDLRDDLCEGRTISVCGVRVWEVTRNGNQGRRECQRCCIVQWRKGTIT